MKQISMSPVARCEMGACAYNDKGMCHTVAINVGPYAECKTYLHASPKAGFDEMTSSVGACTASNCKHNERLECKAPSINVSCFSNYSADCRTFECR